MSDDRKRVVNKQSAPLLRIKGGNLEVAAPLKVGTSFTLDRFSPTEGSLPKRLQL